ncbi:DUF4831 family protein [Gaoshiqia sp. Z1-71]|uniref:DUF4831 family protein n=1 Tax=Gaoshiqia hydrogeniformans TaxID=3290090 RepID=UPI003BF903DB
MKTKYTVLFLLLFSNLALFAQRAKEATPGLAFSDGVVYSLPRTGVRVYVKATQEKFFRGPYYQYAETMLGLKNAPASDSENWTIDDVKIETFSEADPKQVYKAKGSGASLLSLTESGVLAGINKPADGGVESPVVSTFLGETKIPDYPFSDLSLNPFFAKQDSSRRNVIVPKSLQEKAMEAAHTITKLRKRRFKSLANGYDEQLPDGRAYELMVDELGKLEAEYVALFIGKSYQSTFEYCFDFIPGENSVSGEVVFRFSENKGVLPKTDMSGKPIVLDIKKLDDLASAQEKLLSQPTAASGVYYRMPGKAEIRMQNGINLMAATRVDLAQFGTVAPLPEELLDGNHQVVFHPKTGGIKSILQK